MITLQILLFLAQVGYPGQYPPGQYPPGQYPGRYPGGSGIPIPGRGKKTTSTTEKKAADAQSVFFRGVVRQLDAKSVEIVAEDTRIITVQTNDNTAIPKNLAVGDSVEIDAKDDTKGGFLATSIKKTDAPILIPETGQKSAAGETASVEREAAPTTLKGPKYDAGDDGPPVLKRGKPKPHSPESEAVERPEVATNSAPPAPETTSGRPVSILRNGPPPPPSDPRMELIDRAKEAAEGFLVGLPNYVCTENTTRYQSEGKDWNAVDVVSVEVVFRDGKESYQNVQINGKASKKPIEDTGAWSTGEFGTILADLFSPATAAKFKYIRDSSASGIPAALYDFAVDRAHSHWRITIVSQSIFPSYKGSVWIDKKSGRVLRLEMQATQIPPEFPEDAAESAVDYGFVSFGTEKFFLPLHAEILGCHRGTNVCDKNVIEFRNYHKFTGDSKIIFNQ